MTCKSLKLWTVASLVCVSAELGASAAGCGGTERDAQKDAVVQQYVKMVRASYDDSVAGAKTLRTAITKLVTEPSQDTLDAAREAWKASRPAYLQTEAYRFYQGPIDNEETGHEGQINGWPLDEAFIDYVKDGNNVLRLGIINDRTAFPELNKDVLVDQNENGGEDNIATGYHAIEFLLWGQDFSDTGPGDRPYTDYVAGQTGGDPDADRRRQYLGLAADLLVEDLEYTRGEWNDGKDFLKEFLANVDDTAIQDMITGIASLTKQELAAERIQPAYESNDQEDEHSCFSDNTDQDMKFDLVGIQNVYFGRYAKDDGAGLEDLVKVQDAALDKRIKADMDAAETAIANIPKPFDQAIRETNTAGLRKVKAAIDALNTLNDSLAKLPIALKLKQ